MKIVIFVGPTRTSTTSIYRSLRGCSGMVPSIIKETNYLIENKLVGCEKALFDYQSIFELGNSSDIYFEASPLYFMKPNVVVENLNELSRLGAEIVVVFTLRDPVARFYSIYSHIVTKRSIGKYDGFESFLKSNIDSSTNNCVTGDIDEFSLYESGYAKLLGHWSALDRSVRKVVLFSENISQNNNFDTAVRKIFSSSPSVCNESSIFTLLLENQSKEVKYQRIHKLFLGVNNNLEFFLNKFPLVRQFLKTVYYYFNEEEVGSGRESEVRIREILNVTNCGLVEILDEYEIIGDKPSWLRKLS